MIMSDRIVILSDKIMVLYSTIGQNSTDVLLIFLNVRLRDSRFASEIFFLRSCSSYPRPHPNPIHPPIQSNPSTYSKPIHPIRSFESHLKCYPSTRTNPERNSLQGLTKHSIQPIKLFSAHWCNLSVESLTPPTRLFCARICRLFT